MQQKKRHHYVPKAYLNAFCDDTGRLLVYRKDNPKAPLHVKPDATQFRRYYYSQPTPNRSVDNNTLEDLFTTIESEWPETVARLHRRENVNARLENIFQFISLQRARVPAARDAVEAMLAVTVKSTMKAMLAAGELPPPPLGLEDLPERLEVSIDPHRSIHAMVAIMQGMGQLFSRMGLVAVHNATSHAFLTSDNPVIWVDPSLEFERQQPYTIQPDGPVVMYFPVSPRLLLMGAREYSENYSVHGLLHTEAPGERWVDHVNAQICRFGYEAVITQSPGFEAMIAEHAAVSPVHQTTPLPYAGGVATLHGYAFGTRTVKPNWSAP